MAIYPRLIADPTTHNHMSKTSHAQTRSRLNLALDLGFGYTKGTRLSKVSSAKDSPLDAFVFPSYCTQRRGDTNITAGVGTRLDVVPIDVAGVTYLVGPDAIAASHGGATRSPTDGYFTSDQYLAIFRGALAYMALPAEVGQIDCLCIGLPLTVIQNPAIRAAIDARLSGEHQIPDLTMAPDAQGNVPSRKLSIKKLRVVPQVLGSLVHAIHTNEQLSDADDENVTTLTIDVGYGTLLWLTTLGLKPEPARSGGNNGGASALLRVVADRIDPKLSDDARFLDRIDQALRNGNSLRYDGKFVDLSPMRAAIDQKATEFLQALVASVGSIKTIDNILLTGGGSFLYEPALRAAFQGRTIVWNRNECRFANVNGFQAIAEDSQ